MAKKDKAAFGSSIFGCQDVDPSSPKPDATNSRAQQTDPIPKSTANMHSKDP
jgi:hypothetical protein